MPTLHFNFGFWVLFQRIFCEKGEATEVLAVVDYGDGFCALITENPPLP